MRWSLSKLENNGVDGLYRRNQVKSITFLAMLGGILVLTILLSLRAGSYETPLAELVRGIFGRSADRKINIVVQHNRLPRICTGILAGAGLGLAGCVFQAVLRNPLASASTLGVAQGATFGAAFAIVVLGFGSTGGFGIELSAFLGSIAVALSFWRCRDSGRCRRRASFWRVWPSAPCSRAPPRSCSILPTRCSSPRWYSGPSVIWGQWAGRSWAVWR